MNIDLTKKLIAKFRGEDDAKLWASFSNIDAHLLGQAGRELLAGVPPSFGSCAMLSATWVSYLRERYNIPAVVVAGDLILDGNPVFISEGNLPSGDGVGLQDFGEWSGHCWIEIGGYIGDISLFRSAYALEPQHYLAKFVRSRFGEGRGIIVCQADDFDSIGMQYKPKYVLTEKQVNSLWAGLGYVISNRG